MDKNPFEGLTRDRPDLPDGRNELGRFVRGHPVSDEMRAKRIKALKSRKPGEAVTPNMQFSSCVNWLVRTMKGIKLASYIERTLENNPARKNLTRVDNIKLQAFEKRAKDIQALVDTLANELAEWSKKKRMYKEGEDAD